MMRPQPILSAADMRDASTWTPPGHEPIPAIPPPPDDRMELLREFVLHDCDGYKTHSAKVLARRAALGDSEAWGAVARDITGPGRGYASDVADALGKGDLDAAMREAAMVCGDYEVVGDRKVPLPEKWLRETREERARKRGA